MKRQATLKTSRLLLRPLAVADAPALHDAMSDPVAMQYWREPPHASLEVTRRAVEEMVSDKSAHWAIVEPGANRVIGFVGFHSNEPPHGFGYFLERGCWKRGYMFEACGVVLRFGFDTLGYRQAEAWIHEENAASLALAHKLGFQKVGQTSKRRTHISAEAHRFLVYGLWAHDYLGGAAAVSQGIDCHQMEPTLPVLDVSRSIRFYTEVLGFSLAFVFDDPPSYAAVSSSPWSTGARIRLRRLEAGQMPTCSEEIVMTLDDVDEFHLRYAPLAIGSALERQPWGAREFAITDPDGHKLRFMGW